MILWLNGTHGVGKTTTSALVQQLIPDSRVFDAEKVGETLMDITPGLPETDNFQHWPPWRPLVVETARRILDYTGGTLVMPMTVLVEQYWREINAGFAGHAIPVQHFVLHADADTLRRRIEQDTVLGPSTFRLAYLEPVRRGGAHVAARRGRGHQHRPPHARTGRPADRGRGDR
ncbi:AAA family ATPase [Nostocoides sp. HKS02]|uniref:AAA family ATPase n=1 Tax=Nostocoides sp. HKS02 TaxID=1813880 RepID=UPI001E3EC845|nr:AAA family ATPase [Tetrasphaera sp. HKS02]